MYFAWFNLLPNLAYTFMSTYHLLVYSCVFANSNFSVSFEKYIVWDTNLILYREHKIDFKIPWMTNEVYYMIQPVAYSCLHFLVYISLPTAHFSCSLFFCTNLKEELLYLKFVNNLTELPRVVIFLPTLIDKMITPLKNSCI